MVGSSVVYCRRCGRAWSSVVAKFVVACLRSPLSFEMFKTFRRPLATDISVFPSHGSVVEWLCVVVASCRYCRGLSSIVVAYRAFSPRQCPQKSTHDY